MVKIFYSFLKKRASPSILIFGFSSNKRKKIRSKGSFSNSALISSIHLSTTRDGGRFSKESGREPLSGEKKKQRLSVIERFACSPRVERDAIENASLNL